MRQALFTLVVCLSATWAAGGEPAALQWFPGDCSVPAWPASPFSAAQRVRGAEHGGLRWLVVCDVVRARALENPNARSELDRLRTGQVNPILGLQWVAPLPIDKDIVCIGTDPELPLPRPRAQNVIYWANRLGGATILLNPGNQLERHAERLVGLTAFEAFHKGKWNAECLEGGAWDRILARGRRLCIVGGTSAPARSGLGREGVATHVLARSNRERDVVAAIRAGRVVVSDRDHIRFSFTVDGAPPGSVVKPEEGWVDVAIDVRAGEPVDEIKIIGNTRVHGRDTPGDRILALHRLRPEAKRTVRTIRLRLDKSTRYLRGVAVIYRGNCRTMTNPVFIGDLAAPPPEADVRARRLRLVRAALSKLDWEEKDRSKDIVERLLNDHNMGPITAVYIARHYGEKDLGRIRPLLGSRWPAVRALMAYILLQIEGERAVPAVLRLLHDEEAEPRIYAARLLARSARPHHLKLALKAAHDLWPEVRQYALAALARIPCRESLLRLRQALHERVPAVSRASASHLTRMLGVEGHHQEQFIEAFKLGRLQPKLTATVVGRVGLRPLVAEVAAEKLGRLDLLHAAFGRVRSLSAVHVTQRPVIDGLGRDKAWRAAAASEEFVLASGKPAQHQTTVKAVYDQDVLYLLFRCDEPMPDKLVARENQFDGHVWLDDSVDVYVCPSGSRKERDPIYYRFSVNCRGVRFDELRRRQRWDTYWRAAASVGNTAWTLEVALPFRSLRIGRPRRGATKWLVNFARHRRVHPEEESSFAPGDLRTPSNYADLKFE